MATKVKTFLNDEDGLSITDFLSTSFVVVFLVICITVVYKGLILGIEIQDNIVDTLRIMSNPLLVILGGYFGTKMVTKFVDGNNTKLDKKEEARSTEEVIDEVIYPDYPEYNNYLDSEEGDTDYDSAG